MHIPGLCCFGDAALMISILGQGMAIDNMQPTKPLTDTIGNAWHAQHKAIPPVQQPKGAAPCPHWNLMYASQDLR